MTGLGFKRFIVFNYPHYYPGGGSGDVMGSYDTLEEATEACSSDTEFYGSEIFDCDARTFSFPVLP